MALLEEKNRQGNWLVYFLFFALLIPFLALRDFSPTNELRYVGIVQDAMSRHHFFTFFLNGEYYADKPPFFFWLMMAEKALFGSFSVLPLGMLSLVAALLIVWVMNKWTSGVLSATHRTTSAAMLFTSGMFLASAVIVRMDMLMTLFVVLSLYTFFKIYEGTAQPWDKWLLPVYLFLGMFTKWPVGAVIPLLGIGVFLLWKRQAHHIFRYIGIPQILLFAGLTALWWLGAYMECGAGYLNNLLFKQTFGRAVHSFHHKEAVYYYLVTMWYAMSPLILFYLAALVYAIRKKLIQSDMEKFFTSVVAATYVFMSAMSSKVEIYLLPIYPFLAYLSLMIFKKDEGKNWSRISLLVPQVLLVLALPGFLVAMNFMNVPNGTLPWVLAGLIIISGCATYSLWLKREQFHTKVLALALGLLAGIFTASFAIPRVNGYIGMQQVAELADKLAGTYHVKVIYYHPYRSAEFLSLYINHELLPVDDPGLVQTPEKQLIIIDNHDIKTHPEILQNIVSTKTRSSGKYSVIEF